MIKYFNKISIELFQKLSDLKYTIDYIEINENEKYIGINLFTENFNVYITILYYTHENYFTDKNCSIALYDIEDENMQKPEFKICNESISDCINLLLREDLLMTVNFPFYNQN